MLSKNHCLYFLSKLFFGFGFFMRSAFPSVGGGSKSSTSSSSTQNYDASTKVATTNQQVGASEGSTSIGAGGSYDASSGAKVTAGAGSTISTVDSAGLSAALSTVDRANSQVAQIANNVINAAQTSQAQSIGNAQAALDQTRSASLGAQAQVAGISAESQKKILIVSGVALVLVVTVLILKNRK